ncbi:hypothetical protein [Phenylobacterium sp.]|uniref:hypothetical protein n=1 Tax=Phenylobacterium sp. TaxID=1871053 RepID=UPI0025E249D3|nr:hypothetical protein [Phenylobacterium sp.]
MRALGWSTGIAAAASLVAGYHGPAKPPPGPVPRPTGVARPAFSLINKACPPLPANLPAVRISISDVSPKHIGHETALFAANKDGTRSTGDRLRRIPEVQLPVSDPTRLDLDADPFLKKPGDVLLIELELTDPDASFSGGSSALTIGNDDGKAMFCVKDPANGINPKPEDRIVRFYARYVASNRPRLAKFNIFVLVKDRDGPFRTPVVLDPKVHNSG